MLRCLQFLFRECVRCPGMCARRLRRLYRLNDFQGHIAGPQPRGFQVGRKRRTPCSVLSGDRRNDVVEVILSASQEERVGDRRGLAAARPADPVRRQDFRGAAKSIAHQSSDLLLQLANFPNDRRRIPISLRRFISLIHPTKWLLDQ